MSYPKQVIVMRKDLGMRKGKIASQAAHASMAALLSAGTKLNDENGLVFSLAAREGSAVELWLNGAFTKITVYVNNEQELDDIYAKAQAAGLLSALIIDNGLTEFKGVKTKTCCAIGPVFPEQLVGITDHLPLL